MTTRDPLPSSRGVALFDRVGERALALAHWILEDEQAAADVVVSTFARANGKPSHLAPAPSTADEADALHEVRRRAIDAHAARVGSRHDGNGRHPMSTRSAWHPTSRSQLRDAVAALPEADRAALELALFGRLDTSEIAGATATSRTEVWERLMRALRMLAGTSVVPLSEASLDEGTRRLRA